MLTRYIDQLRYENKLLKTRLMKYGKETDKEEDDDKEPEPEPEPDGQKTAREVKFTTNHFPR